MTSTPSFDVSALVMVTDTPHAPATQISIATIMSYDSTATNAVVKWSTAGYTESVAVSRIVSNVMDMPRQGRARAPATKFSAPATKFSAPAAPVKKKARKKVVAKEPVVKAKHAKPKNAKKAVVATKRRATSGGQPEKKMSALKKSRKEGGSCSHSGGSVSVNGYKRSALKGCGSGGGVVNDQLRHPRGQPQVTWQHIHERYVECYRREEGMAEEMENYCDWIEKSGGLSGSMTPNDVRKKVGLGDFGGDCNTALAALFVAYDTEQGAWDNGWRWLPLPHAGTGEHCSQFYPPLPVDTCIAPRKVAKMLFVEGGEGKGGEEKAVEEEEEYGEYEFGETGEGEGFGEACAFASDSSALT